jgi:hypothetical protein
VAAAKKSSSTDENNHSAPPSAIIGVVVGITVLIVGAVVVGMKNARAESKHAGERAPAVGRAGTEYVTKHNDVEDALEVEVVQQGDLPRGIPIVPAEGTAGAVAEAKAESGAKGGDAVPSSAVVKPF